jgi:hypothetical protein
MAKITVSLDQLRRLMLAEVRKQQGCDEVVGVEICRVSDAEAESNWSGSVISFGSTSPDVARRAAQVAESTLQRTYHLFTVPPNPSREKTPAAQ